MIKPTWDALAYDMSDDVPIQPRRIIKVTSVQVAAAQALVQIRGRLGKPVSPAIRKIAEAKPMSASTRRGFEELLERLT